MRTTPRLLTRCLALSLFLSLGIGPLAGCKEEANDTASNTAPAAQEKALQEQSIKGANANAIAAGTLTSDKEFLHITEVKTEGGLTAWLVEDHSLPLLSLSFAFAGAGAVNDPVDKQGLSRMVSNTMDEGAADLDSEAFRKLMADNSISLGFSSSRDDFSGSLYTLTANRDLAFDLLHKAVSAPRFDNEPVDRMRAANMARIKSSLSDPSWLAARLLNDVAFDNHPYALNSGGTLTSLQAISTDDLRKFTASYLTRDRLKIAVVGDIDAKTLAAALDKIFGDLPETGLKTEVADTAIQHSGETVLYKSEIPQTMIRVLQTGIGRKDPAYHAFQVMNFILGGNGFGSRLMKDVREERGLTYGIYSSLFLLDHAKGLSISTSTANKNVGEVLDLIRAALEKMKTEPVTADELQSAQSYLIGSMPLSLTSSRGIASMVLSLQLEDRPIHYLDTIDEKIAGITIEEIQDIAAKTLTPEALTTILVGGPEGITPTRIVEDLPNVE